MQSTIKWRFAQYLEIRWWRNYLKNKDVIAYLNWKRSYWQRFLLRLPDNLLPPDAQVLDAGCGPAGIFIALPNFRVTAVDPLLADYANELPHFKEINYPWVRFVNTPLETFSDTEQYDCIFTINAFNHFADLHAALQILDKHLQIGGFCVITLDTHRWFLTKLLLKWLPVDALHPHQYSLPEYQMFIQEAQPNWTLVKYDTLQAGWIFNYDLFIWTKPCNAHL